MVNRFGSRGLAGVGKLSTNSISSRLFFSSTQRLIMNIMMNLASSAIHKDQHLHSQIWRSNGNPMIVQA